MTKPTTADKRHKSGGRVSVIDAHNSRVEIVNKHKSEKRPTLTAFAWAIIERERKGGK